jgi:hypothetical protein
MSKIPVDVFEDVKGSDFSKHNKKNVSEDYVSENLKEYGWKIYRPFNDTGIDLIAIKNVCPKGCTSWDEITSGKTCKKCGEKLIEVIRYIQVKTREVKGKDSNTFGYTLKSKDFRTDPRHVFLLYSDHTKHFIILPIFEYLNVFSKHLSAGLTHFSTPTFRQGNGKLNSLKIIDGDWKWSYNKKTNLYNYFPKNVKFVYYDDDLNENIVQFDDKNGGSLDGGTIYFDKYVNEKGMELLSDPKWDLNKDKYIAAIQKLKFQLFYSYLPGTQNKLDNLCKLINENQISLQSKSSEDIIKIRHDVLSKLKEELSKELIKSISQGYFVKFKGVDFDE